jgi:hypothetical protein
VGPYIVTIPTYDTDGADGNGQIGDGKGVQVQKLSWPDASLISVNGNTADANGNVNVVFADLLRTSSSEGTIGQDLADAIFKIVPESVNTGRFALYELLPDNEGSPVAVPYAKLHEVTDLSAAVFERFTLTDETIAKLSGNVYAKIDSVDTKLTDNINTLSANVFNKIDTVNDNLMNEITTLSGNVYAKIAEGNTELANKIGNADQDAAEGNYELIINNSVLSQLKRIYGDLTSITENVTTISGDVDRLSGTVNTNHEEFKTLKVTLQNGDVAGLKYFETDWTTILDSSLNVTTGEIVYEKIQVTASDIANDNIIGSIGGIGGFNAKNLEVNQYVHTLKVPGDFQIVASYITENNEKRLVYPDVVYSQNANYISVLSDSAEIPGKPWKFFITKNINI